MASRLAVSVGVYIARPRQTRTGLVRCRSVLCAKSYEMKKIGPPQGHRSSSSSSCGGCVVGPGSNVRPAAPAVDGRACIGVDSTV